VPGLRREEVALLAGVSFEYYARMERGDLSGVSPEALGRLCQALHLDEAETGQLHDLARAAKPRPARRKNPEDQAVRPSLRRFLDAIGARVWIRDRRMAIIATNGLGRALFAHTAEPGSPTEERLALLGSLAVTGPTPGGKPSDR
jgi:transcriptional regulator with XRE-family HTH domain